MWNGIEYCISLCDWNECLCIWMVIIKNWLMIVDNMGIYMIYIKWIIWKFNLG